MRRCAPAIVATSAVLGFAAGALVGWEPLARATHLLQDFASPRPVVAREAPLDREEARSVALFERASPSVVSIAASHLRDELVLAGEPAPVRIDPRALRPSWVEWQTTRGEIRVPEAETGRVLTFDPARTPENFDWDSGSGFVWDGAGHVVTNYHVVEGAWDLRVRLADLSEWPARLIGYDEDKDLAVLHIDADARRLHPIGVGSSSDLRVGQRAFSIGNPYGLSSTLTEGIIAALRRTIRSGTGAGRIIQDVIQIDAPIRPGNSGGPLLDSAGRLIGVTTAIVAEADALTGIGFAVPVDTVNRIVPDLINFGRPRRAGLGVTVVTELDRRIPGVMIAHVLPDSAAEKAGLRGGLNPRTSRLQSEGDVIVALDGQAIACFDDLYRLLDQCEPGDLVELAYVRGGERLAARIELQPLFTPGVIDGGRAP